MQYSYYTVSKTNVHCSLVIIIVAAAAHVYTYAVHFDTARERGGSRNLSS